MSAKLAVYSGFLRPIRGMRRLLRSVRAFSEIAPIRVCILCGRVSLPPPLCMGFSPARFASEVKRARRVRHDAADVLQG